MTERDIFLAALDIDEPTQRSAYLETACAGDTALRQRVEELLRSHTSAGSFLEQPAVAPEASETKMLDPGSGHRACLDPPTKPGTLGRLDHYEIRELVGQGAMGIVFKAFDEKLHRVVAVKVMSPELASNPVARNRFSKEAKAAAAVTHEHVVTIHAVETDRNPPYLVMQYVSGISLYDKLKLSGPPGLKEILRIGSQIADGLAAAHRQGLVHRDIKPANILLENGIERVKITDFGLARAVDDIGATQTGVVAGTPQYMSPEQALGDSIDHRSDLFSLGGVLYALCTGRAPFRADSTVAVLRRVCDEAPRPIREVNPDIPEWLTQIVEKLLEKKPVDRYQTAAEVSEVLRSHLASLQEPIPAGRPMIPTASGSAPPPLARSRVPVVSRTTPVPRPRMVPVLATLNLLAAILLMLLTSYPDKDIERLEPFWQIWSHVDNALSFVMSAALFAAAIGLYLWQPWARRLIVGVCIFGLVAFVVDMPYMMRSLIPQFAADLNQEYQTDIPIPEEREAATVATLGVLLVPVATLQLVFLIGQLVYFMRPRVVAAFSAEGLATNSANIFEPTTPQKSGTSWGVVLLILLLACGCPGMLVLLCIGGWAFTAVEAHQQHESLDPAETVGEPAVKAPEDASLQWEAMPPEPTNPSQRPEAPKPEAPPEAPKPETPPEAAQPEAPLDPSSAAAVRPTDGVARPPQAAWARHLGIPEEYTNSLGMKFRLIPPGSFQMGTSPEELEVLNQLASNDRSVLTRDGWKAEVPQQTVRLTKPWYCGVHEVRYRDMERFTAEKGYETEAEADGNGGYGSSLTSTPFRKQDPKYVWRTPSDTWKSTDDHPVTQVTPVDAEAFCKWLSDKEGLTYRLPTSAEWEFAARAGEPGRYSFGDDPAQLTQHAWIAENSGIKAQPVARKQANPFGLHDLHGNVQEWTADWYAERPGSTEPLVDPVGPSAGALRVLRGGSWDHHALDCRSAMRDAQLPHIRIDTIGFRIVITGDLKGVNTPKPEAPETPDVAPKQL